MAKSDKTKKDQVDDANETSVTSDAEATVEDSAEAVTQGEEAEETEQAVPGDNPSTGDEETHNGEESVQEPLAEETNDTLDALPVSETEPAGSGFFPGLLGGVLAAGLGLGAVQYMTDDWPFGSGEPAEDPKVAELTARLADMEQKLQETDARAVASLQPNDLQALTEGQMRNADALGSLSGQIEGVSASVVELGVRLDTLEKRPLQEGASDAAVAAYERELAKLQEAIAAQRADVERMANEAATLEENAEEKARETLARAAITRILSALDNGDAFTSVLGDLDQAGVQVPQVLRDAAGGGIATRDALRDSFPDASRAALAAHRDGQAGSEGGLGAFLRNQLGARSVTPRAGDDPDAVLSRVEVAVRQGRLNDALAEIETLPDAPRAALADWAAQATARRDAVNAANALADSLSQE